MVKKRPLIIDTDPGLDDSIAILMLINHEDFDVQALTVVGGNKPLSYCVNNALGLVQLSKKDIKVARGAAKPLAREFEETDDVHGPTGLGNILLPNQQVSISEKNCVDTIIEQALRYNGDLEILAIAPLTNIALALKKFPKLPSLIRQITIMGGAIYKGNQSPVAEFNIYIDPEAAKIVFNSGLKINMVCLETTEGGYITKDDLSTFPRSENTVYQTALQIIKEYVYMCETIYNREQFVIHDAVAAAILVDENISTKNHYWVDIETKGEITRGMTVVDTKNISKNTPNCYVFTDTKKEAYRKILADSLYKLCD